MKLSDGEKLILIMMSDICEKLEIDGELDPGFIKSAICSENAWGINLKYSGIPFEDDETPAEVKEVFNILNMWSFIESSYAKLSKEDKLAVEKEAKPFGKDPEFRGFDGNNETTERGIALFLVKDLNRFEKFKGRDLNSHMPSIGAYRRMYSVFEPMCKDSMGSLLSAQQLINLLLEQTHPGHS